ncbi:excinuclease ABC subunit UvrB [bacterium]|jgi:excinuclease ABC subunit B|nr:excinuclease ABC subunit UvrB [bacterium]MBT4335719.1 excinuclease ABC subunit UvrB [bacterium]MBT4495379.1 excinuclease ABC subunit UvrB [bacterium]MBT4763604.1 excinuclease ABC subunit UvrB [bacterium]MBT5400976.1 excinuclease ABC subunit UvrB [bacterium]
MNKFKLQSKFKPTGDQPQAIAKLNSGLKNYKDQTLLGVTGSGKTFTMANIIAKYQKPTLVISHNKTLAAQLASEFKRFFPDNAVHYFVSYYDYYQPEAYVVSSDTYIEKETDINEEIDRLRHASTNSLLSRKDVIIVASVSCIYGLGSKEFYQDLSVKIKVNEKISIQEFLKKLVNVQFTRNEIEFKRGTFRVRGDTVEVFPVESSEDIVTVEFFGDKIDKITKVNFLTRRKKETLDNIVLFPVKHFVTPETTIKRVNKEIENDMKKQIKYFKKNNKLIEAQRIEERTKHDLEMMNHVGYCNGIENYSRYLTGRAEGVGPETLIDYFPKDFLLFVDESHMTIPQINGMYRGDKARKENLIEYGFRLPSALDNRPLKFKEFEKKVNKIIYVSATPAGYEYDRSGIITKKIEVNHKQKLLVDYIDLKKKVKEKGSAIAQQVIRPTGLLDPEIELRKSKYQVDDLLNEIKLRTDKKERVLVTTLTKRLAEELTDYLNDLKVKVQYLHSEVDTLDRIEIIKDLRLGKYDVLVGINLLREGLDLPEVSLVAILDADKEGFLRSETALIQTMGRAARHVEGKVIMYADKMTNSMKRAILETKRRRKIQEAYNIKHKITPKGIEKEIDDSFTKNNKVDEKAMKKLPRKEKAMLIHDLENQMKLVAENLEFEKAASIRDQIKKLKK